MVHRIVIVGGGFGGVTAALTLADARLPNAHITLITDKPWLEYYGVLYRLIDNGSVSEACLPLKMIIGSRAIDVIIDEVQSIDVAKKTVTGKHLSYNYDTVIVAPGSVPAYFNIPGMEEHSMTMKSIAQAIEIGETVKKRVDAIAKERDPKKQKMLGRFLVVGAGPTGIEIAGEVLPLAKKLMKQKQLDLSIISVEIIEAMSRVLPVIEEHASKKVHTRLESMGIKVHLNTAVASADATSITLKDGSKIDAGTIFWTAGVKPSPLIAAIDRLELDKRGRVLVDEQLRAKGHTDMFVLGDCASTPFAGLAQTAVGDGAFASKVIAAAIKNRSLPTYKPQTPAYAIPAGPHWAAVKFGALRTYGWIGYIMRRAADIHVYVLVLPWRFIPKAFLGKIDLRKYSIGLENSKTEVRNSKQY